MKLPRWIKSSPLFASLLVGAMATPALANDTPTNALEGVDSSITYNLEDEAGSTVSSYYADQDNVDTQDNVDEVTSVEDLFELEGLSAQQIKDQAYQYYNGRGVDQNQARAIILYETAAEMGNQQAIDDLAYLEARESYDPNKDHVASYENDRPRTIAELQAQQLAFSTVPSTPENTALAAATENQNQAPFIIGADAVTADTVAGPADSQPVSEFANNDEWSQEWLTWYKQNCSDASQCRYYDVFVEHVGASPDDFENEAQLAQYLDNRDNTNSQAVVSNQTCDINSSPYANNDEWAGEWLTYFKNNCDNNPANARWASVFQEHTGIDPTADDAAEQLAVFLGNTEYTQDIESPEVEVALSQPALEFPELSALDIELPNSDDLNELLAVANVPEVTDTSEDRQAREVSRCEVAFNSLQVESDRELSFSDCPKNFRTMLQGDWVEVSGPHGTVRAVWGGEFPADTDSFIDNRALYCYGKDECNTDTLLVARSTEFRYAARGENDNVQLAANDDVNSSSAPVTTSSALILPTGQMLGSTLN